ncbi:MAG: sulfatase [Planctomycetaceae bacterium]|nr:sulfatase [Planctomycetaceae bacterium]
MIPRRWFSVTLLLCATACTATLARPCLAADAKRPNIIMLLTDDQRWDTLGCMGNKIIKTPNVDRLASQGVVFDNVFVTTSICMTNRACIFTGQYASRHGVIDFKTSFTPEQLAETYPGQLKQAGYYTGFIGKWGVGNPPKDYFDYNKGWPGQHQYFPDKNNLSIHLTSQMGDQAIEFLDGTPGDRPFLLAFSFKAPHVQDGDPNTAMKIFTPEIRALYKEFPGGFLHDPKLEPLYRDVVFPPPALSDPAFFASLPTYFEPTETRKRWEWRFSTPEMYQRSVKAYYSLITGVDNVVGRIIKKLEEKGQFDNTVILYHGDNGFYLGERGFAGKWYAHEPSLRVPLVIYDPRLPADQKGTRREQFALSIDLAPTMLDMAGVARPGRMQGESLVPILRGETPEWRDEFFYEHMFDNQGIPKSVAVRGRQFKYIRYLVDDPRNEEFFDFKNDPQEANNLVNNPEYADLLKEMRAKLAAWQARVK